MSGWLQCDACAAQFVDDAVETQAELVAAARAAGWTGRPSSSGRCSRCCCIPQRRDRLHGLTGCGMPRRVPTIPAHRGARRPRIPPALLVNGA